MQENLDIHHATDSSRSSRALKYCALQDFLTTFVGVEEYRGADCGVGKFMYYGAKYTVERFEDHVRGADV